MNSFQNPMSGSSDDESADDDMNPTVAQESRITNLGSNLAIPPQSDVPESEGPEEDVYHDTPRDPPVVAIINNMITANRDTSAAPKELPSSSPGKLKRPSSDHIHRTSFIPRGDIYDISASPERDMNPRSGDPLREPLRKSKRVASPRHHQRRIRTASKRNMLDTDATSDRLIDSHSTMHRAQQHHPAQEPPTKRQKLDCNPIPAPRYQLRDKVHEPEQELVQSNASTSTSGARTTRSMKNSVLTSLDLTKSLRPRSRQIVQVLVTNTASIRPASDNTDIQPQPLQPPPAIAPDAELAAESSAKSIVDVREEDRDHADSAHPEVPAASPEVAFNDSQPPGVDEGQIESYEDSALFESPTEPARDTRSQAEVLARDVQRVHEQYNTDDFGDDLEDDAPQTEDLEGEKNDWEDIPMPKQLVTALKNAHRVHEDAENIWRKFDGNHILKSYASLRQIVSRWRAVEDYSQTNELVKLSNRITKEAKAMLTKPAWDQHKGLEYLFKRVLPTLVRMLFVSCAYYLTEVKTMDRMPHAPLNELRSVAKTVIDLTHKARHAARKRHTCPSDVVSMVARTKEMRDEFDRLLRNHRPAKDEVESIERQQTRRLRQEALDREDRDELKLREWRQRWRVLHDQRLGAELEGRTFISRNDNHLRQISLDNPYVVSPYWDPDRHVYYLAEGLQEFAGPHVYRDIFRRYCRQDGPLREFNVAEIVDKAVSLKQQLVKVAEEDNEEVDPWVESIFDPRVRPEGLHRDEGRS